MKIECSNCEAENESTSKYCSICGYKLPKNECGNPAEKTPVKKTGPNKKTEILKRSLGFVLGFFIVFFTTQFFLKPSVDKELVNISNEINKVCPMRIDQYTQLDNTVILPNKTIQYNYTLVDITKAEVNLDTVKKYVFPGLLENVKTSPDMKLLRDNKVIFNYYYNDKKGAFVCKYIIKPEMYE